MPRIPPVRRFRRGGLTALIGSLVTLAGVIGGIVAVSEYNWFYPWVNSAEMPLPEYAILEDWILLLFSAISAGIGVMLVAFATEERRREEVLDLDPLHYAPFRRPLWPKVLPGAVALVVILVVPGFYAIPQAHPVHYEVPVPECATAYEPVSVNIPAGATLAHQWHSSNGAPITEVGTPNPPVVGFSALASDFVNSSYGHGSVSSTGAPIVLWACDTGPVPAGLDADFTGAYYVFP